MILSAAEKFKIIQSLELAAFFSRHAADSSSIHSFSLAAAHLARRDLVIWSLLQQSATHSELPPSARCAIHFHSPVAFPHSPSALGTYRGFPHQLFRPLHPEQCISAPTEGRELRVFLKYVEERPAGAAKYSPRFPFLAIRLLDCRFNGH